MWLERERVMQEGQCKGLSLGSTRIAMEQYWLPLIWLFVCFIPVTSQAQNGIIYYSFWSIITIVDMSQSHSECFGDPDDGRGAAPFLFPRCRAGAKDGMHMLPKGTVRMDGLLLDSVPL